MKLETQFNRGQEVKIVPLNRNGRIVAIWFGDNGLQYNVRYFDNAEAKTVYFYENELAVFETATAIGLKS